MEPKPTEYPYSSVTYDDAEDTLRESAVDWLRERVELAAPGIKFRQDYDWTADQQRFNFLRGLEQRCVMPGDKNQERGEFRATKDIFNKPGGRYLDDALQRRSFRPALLTLWPSLAQLRVPLGQWWLSFTPDAPNKSLVVNERGQLADAAQYVAVLSPVARHANDEPDVNECLPTQCDLALRWHTSEWQCDEGHSRRTLSLSYANTCLQFEVDGLVSGKLPQEARYFALRPCAILQRLLK